MLSVQTVPYSRGRAWLRADSGLLAISDAIRQSTTNMDITNSHCAAPYLLVQNYVTDSTPLLHRPRRSLLARVARRPAVYKNNDINKSHHNKMY